MGVWSGPSHGPRASRNSYLMLGDTTTAAARLSTFIELWDEAEPALQLVVADAKLRLSQLVGEREPR